MCESGFENTDRAPNRIHTGYAMETLLTSWGIFNPLCTGFSLYPELLEGRRVLAIICDDPQAHCLNANKSISMQNLGLFLNSYDTPFFHEP